MTDVTNSELERYIFLFFNSYVKGDLPDTFIRDVALDIRKYDGMYSLIRDDFNVFGLIEFIAYPDSMPLNFPLLSKVREKLRVMRAFYGIEE